MTARALNISRNTTMQLKSHYNNVSKAGLKSCDFNALKTEANAKVASYKEYIAGYQTQISGMASKGFNTSSLAQAIQNENSTVVTPLQNAINAATNSSQMSAAITGYCLFNGCKKGVNGHLAAAFTLQKLTAITNKVATVNNTNATQIAQVRSDLSVAQSTLVTVGTSVYTNGQNATVWNNLHSAASLLKTLIKNAGGS